MGELIHIRNDGISTRIQYSFPIELSGFPPLTVSYASLILIVGNSHYTIPKKIQILDDIIPFKREKSALFNSWSGVNIMLLTIRTYRDEKHIYSYPNKYSDTLVTK